MDIGRWPPESIAAPPNAPPYSHHFPPSHHHHLASSSFSHPPVSHFPQSKDPAAAAAAAATSTAAKLALHHQDYGLLVAQSAAHHYEYVGHADASVRPPGIGSPSAGLGNPSYAPQSIGAEAAYQVFYSYQEEPHKQHALLAKESIRQYGVDPLAYASMVQSQSVVDPTTATAAAAAAAWNQTYAAFSNVLPKKLITKKKNKVVQSAYCAVCKIDCNSKDVLDKHKAGKKHLRNLNKLAEAKNPKKVLAGGAAVDTKKTPPATNEKQIASVAPMEDLETKRRKVLEGGAPAAEVRVCMLCGIVCNSKTVYDLHIAGKKHAAQLQKMAEAGAVSAV